MKRPLSRLRAFPYAGPPSKGDAPGGLAKPAPRVARSAMDH